MPKNKGQPHVTAYTTRLETTEKQLAKVEALSRLEEIYEKHLSEINKLKIRWPNNFELPADVKKRDANISTLVQALRVKFQTGMQLQVISNLQELEALSSTCMQEMLKIKNNCDWLFSKQIFNVEEEIKAQLEEKRADLSAATKLSEPEVTVSSPVAIPSQGLDSVPHLSQQPSAMSKDDKNETQVLVTGSSLFGEELSQTLVKPNNMAHVREMQLTKVIRQLEQLQLKIEQLNDDKYGDAAKALQFIHTGISTVNQQFIDGNLTREAYRQACERVFKQADVDELQTFRYLKTKKIAEVLVNLIALVATAFVGYGVAACALKRYSVFQFNTDSTNRVNKLQSEVACAASPAA